MSNHLHFKTKNKEIDKTENKYLLNNVSATTAPSSTIVTYDKSKLDELIQSALKQGDYFKDGLNRPFATVEINGHKRTMKISSTEFKSYLRIKVCKNVAARATIETAVDHLSSICTCNDKIKLVHYRVAGLNDDIYIDIGDESYQAIKISASGWQIVTDPPVKFIRSQSTSELPIPIKVEGGSILDLRKFLPVMDDEDFIMLVSWIVSSFSPSGPYTILTLTGAQGSGKSTLVRIIRSLIDPSKSCNRMIPNNQRDIAIYAINSWIMDFDNITNYSNTISEILCSIATKGTFATRILYSDDSEMVFPIMRPIILSGIDNLNPESDLVHRAVVLNLPAMKENKRLPEELFWKEFNSIKPALMGFLCNAVSAALKHKQSVENIQYPRMADFARLSIAATHGLPWQAEDFISSYQSNIKNIGNAQLEGDPVASVIIFMMHNYYELIISATEVYQFMESQKWISEKIKKSEAWPKSVNSLKNKLARVSTFLQMKGIEMNLKHRTKDIRNYKFTNHNLTENKINLIERNPVKLVATDIYNQIDSENQEIEITDRPAEQFDNLEEFIKTYDK
jgi:energy-coupling factor transporter ATP-binding protein EcfA2